MPVSALPPHKLRRVCNQKHFLFSTTAELETSGTIIGQPRGTRAIEFGMGMPGQGYNVFILGETGTGRTTAIRRFLEEETARREPSPDWVYVHNFSAPQRPQAIRLPAGRGAALQADVSHALERLQRELPRVFDGDAYRQALRDLSDEDEAQQQELLDELNRDMAAAVVHRHLRPLQEEYAGLPQVPGYLQAMQKDVLLHLYDFLPGEGEQPDLRRYEVNLFVDNSQTQGAPVVVELNPTYMSLVGRMEYGLFRGGMAPHFTTLRAGSLHRANGGYLIVYARELRRHPEAWEALKRALKAQQVRLLPPETLQGSYVLAQSLEPEPIPLQVKVILLGGDADYYELYDHEEEFSELFKVKADFDSAMTRDDEGELAYARFVAERCRQEGLRPFDRAAVEKVVEHGSRLSGDQNRLSTRFGAIADVLREADYWARQAGDDCVRAEDVQTALAERAYRSNRLQEELQKQILQGDTLIATEGAVLGQVNGLSVLDTGDYSFGEPGRITARTYMGEDGVVNIEREVEMAGPIHNKGLLTLIGYLGGTYAQNQPLSLSASLTFEQNYMEIDGDSASAAELYALLSSLSGLPVMQSRSVTGSINQHGQMQPVGGVSEKIEGFFDICRARGLTGEQGALIPAANVNNLMLREDVVEAVREGLFHVWAIDTVEEGTELLLGQPAGERDEEGHYPSGTVHHRVQQALRRLALELKSFGDQHEEEG